MTTSVTTSFAPWTWISHSGIQMIALASGSMIEIRDAANLSIVSRIFSHKAPVTSLSYAVAGDALASLSSSLIAVHAPLESENTQQLEQASTFSKDSAGYIVSWAVVWQRSFAEPQTQLWKLASLSLNGHSLLLSGRGISVWHGTHSAEDPPRFQYTEIWADRQENVLHAAYSPQSRLFATVGTLEKFVVKVWRRYTVRRGGIIYGLLPLPQPAAVDSIVWRHAYFESSVNVLLAVCVDGAAYVWVEPSTDKDFYCCSTISGWRGVPRAFAWMYSMRCDLTLETATDNEKDVEPCDWIIGVNKGILRMWCIRGLEASLKLSPDVFASPLSLNLSTAHLLISPDDNQTIALFVSGYRRHRIDGSPVALCIHLQRRDGALLSTEVQFNERKGIARVSRQAWLRSHRASIEAVICHPTMPLVATLAHCTTTASRGSQSYTVPEVLFWWTQENFIVSDTLQPSGIVHGAIQQRVRAMAWLPQHELSTDLPRLLVCYEHGMLEVLGCQITVNTVNLCQTIYPPLPPSTSAFLRAVAKETPEEYTIDLLPDAEHGLGIVLDEMRDFIVVSRFKVDPKDGKQLPGQRCGKIELMDVFIGLNGNDVVGKSLNEVLKMVHAIGKSKPMKLTFRRYPLKDHLDRVGSQRVSSSAGSIDTSEDRRPSFQTQTSQTGAQLGSEDTSGEIDPYAIHWGAMNEMEWQERSQEWKVLVRYNSGLTLHSVLVDEVNREIASIPVTSSVRDSTRQFLVVALDSTPKLSCFSLSGSNRMSFRHSGSPSPTLTEEELQFKKFINPSMTYSPTSIAITSTATCGGCDRSSSTETNMLLVGNPYGSVHLFLLISHSANADSDRSSMDGDFFWLELAQISCGKNYISSLGLPQGESNQVLTNTAHFVRQKGHTASQVVPLFLKSSGKAGANDDHHVTDRNPVICVRVGINLFRVAVVLSAEPRTIHIYELDTAVKPAEESAADTNSVSPDLSSRGYGLDATLRPEELQQPILALEWGGINIESGDQTLIILDGEVLCLYRKALTAPRGTSQWASIASIPCLQPAFDISSCPASLIIAAGESVDELKDGFPGCTIESKAPVSLSRWTDPEGLIRKERAAFAMRRLINDAVKQGDVSSARGGISGLSNLSTSAILSVQYQDHVLPDWHPQSMLAALLGVTPNALLDAERDRKQSTRQGSSNSSKDSFEKRHRYTLKIFRWLLESLKRTSRIEDAEFAFLASNSREDDLTYASNAVDHYGSLNATDDSAGDSTAQAPGAYDPQSGSQSSNSWAQSSWFTNDSRASAGALPNLSSLALKESGGDAFTDKEKQMLIKCFEDLSDEILFPGSKLQGGAATCPVNYGFLRQLMPEDALQILSLYNFLNNYEMYIGAHSSAGSIDSSGVSFLAIFGLSYEMVELQKRSGSSQQGASQPQNNSAIGLRSLDHDAGRALVSLPEARYDQAQQQLNGHADTLTNNSKPAELAVPAAAVICAMCSQSQNRLVEQISGILVPKSGPFWGDLRSLWLGLWMRDTSLLREIFEKMARAEYARNKDPLAVSLYYLTLGRKQVLAGLFRIASSVQGKQLAAFLANDFTQERWRAAAIKNAYALLRKREYSVAAAMFILHQPPKLHEATRIIVNHLNDPSLALCVARLVEALDPLIKDAQLPSPVSTSPQDGSDPQAQSRPPITTCLGTLGPVTQTVLCEDVMAYGRRQKDNQYLVCASLWAMGRCQEAVTALAETSAQVVNGTATLRAETPETFVPKARLEESINCIMLPVVADFLIAKYQSSTSKVAGETDVLPRQIGQPLSAESCARITALLQITCGTQFLHKGLYLSAASVLHSASQYLTTENHVERLSSLTRTEILSLGGRSSVSATSQGRSSVSNIRNGSESAHASSIFDQFDTSHLHISSDKQSRDASGSVGSVHSDIFADGTESADLTHGERKSVAQGDLDESWEQLGNTEQSIKIPRSHQVAIAARLTYLSVASRALQEILSCIPRVSLSGNSQEAARDTPRSTSYTKIIQQSITNIVTQACTAFPLLERSQLLMTCLGLLRPFKHISIVVYCLLLRELGEMSEANCFLLSITYKVLKTSDYMPSRALGLQDFRELLTTVNQLEICLDFASSGVWQPFGPVLVLELAVAVRIGIIIISMSSQNWGIFQVLLANPLKFEDMSSLSGVSHTDSNEKKQGPNKALFEGLKENLGSQWWLLPMHLSRSGSAEEEQILQSSQLSSKLSPLADCEELRNFYRKALQLLLLKSFVGRAQMTFDQVLSEIKAQKTSVKSSTELGDADATLSNQTLSANLPQPEQHVSLLQTFKSETGLSARMLLSHIPPPSNNTMHDMFTGTKRWASTFESWLHENLDRLARQMRPVWNVPSHHKVPDWMLRRLSYYGEQQPSGTEEGQEVTPASPLRSGMGRGSSPSQRLVQKHQQPALLGKGSPQKPLAAADGLQRRSSMQVMEDLMADSSLTKTIDTSIDEEMAVLLRMQDPHSGVYQMSQKLKTNNHIGIRCFRLADAFRWLSTSGIDKTAFDSWQRLKKLERKGHVRHLNKKKHDTSKALLKELSSSSLSSQDTDSVNSASKGDVNAKVDMGEVYCFIHPWEVEAIDNVTEYVFSGKRPSEIQLGWECYKDVQEQMSTELAKALLHDDASVSLWRSLRVEGWLVTAAASLRLATAAPTRWMGKAEVDSLHSNLQTKHLKHIAESEHLSKAGRGNPVAAASVTVAAAVQPENLAPAVASVSATSSSSTNLSRKSTGNIEANNKPSISIQSGTQRGSLKYTPATNSPQLRKSSRSSHPRLDKDVILTIDYLKGICDHLRSNMLFRHLGLAHRFISLIDVELIQASDLQASNIFTGTSNPYVFIQLGHNSTVNQLPRLWSLRCYRSRVINNSLSPSWGSDQDIFRFRFPIPLGPGNLECHLSTGQRVTDTFGYYDFGPPTTIMFSIFSKSTLTEDGFLGKAQLKLHALSETSPIDAWLPLETVSSGRIRVRVSQRFALMGLLDKEDIKVLDPDRMSGDSIDEPQEVNPSG